MYFSGIWMVPAWSRCPTMVQYCTILSRKDVGVLLDFMEWMRLSCGASSFLGTACFHHPLTSGVLGSPPQGILAIFSCQFCSSSCAESFSITQTTVPLIAFHLMCRAFSEHFLLIPKGSKICPSQGQTVPC